MSNKSVIFSILVLNFIILIGSVANYYYVVAPFSNDIEENFDEKTSSLAIKSSEIIKGYSEKEKLDNIDKIIFLYDKITSYLDPLEKFMFEASEAISHYSYIIFIVSIVNLVLGFMLVRNGMHEIKPRGQTP